MCYLYLFLILVGLIGCGGPVENISPISTFDSPFPKKNKDLTSILGDQLKLRQGNDTLLLKIESNKAFNIITNAQNGDTLFKGKVCKYRGLYYFNEQLNDSSYWIYAVKIYNNLIYGFNTDLIQASSIDTTIESGRYPKLVKFMDLDNGIIRLRTDKKEMKRLFSSIIDSFPADTILFDKETYKIKTIEAKLPIQIDSDDNDFVMKVYPNPTKRFLNIDLKNKSDIQYQLISVNSKVLIQGKLNGLSNKLDLIGNKNGFYILTLTDPINKQSESIKIIKEQ